MSHETPAGQKLRNALASMLVNLSIKLMAWAVNLSPDSISSPQGGPVVTPDLSGGPRERA